MPTIVEKIIGIESTIQFFSWDLLLKQQKRSLAHLSHITFVIFSKKKIYRSHYFYRFLENLFFRYTKYLFFNYKKLVSNQNINKWHLYKSTLKFQQSEPEMYMFLLFTLLFLSRSNIRIYPEYKQGPDHVLLLFKDLTSYNVLPLHNFPRDEDWSEKAQALFFIKPNMRHKEKLQFFSLLKIQ